MELTGGDGLALGLDETTGAVTRLAVRGESLPLLPGPAGGLTVREFVARPAEVAAPVAVTDFEGADGWRPYAGLAQQPVGSVAAERRTDGGAEGSAGYARLGATRNYGHGVCFSGDLAVTPERTYTISWQGRVPAIDATYIVYVHAFDAAGRDVTTETQAPKGWEYSPYSHTHYQCLIAAKQPAVWERFSRSYRVAEGVATLRLAVCLWRGDHVDLDRLRVEAAGGAVPGPTVLLAGPVQRTPDGRGAVQHLTSAALHLSGTLTWSPGPTGIGVEIALSDRSDPPRGRALEVSYRLPPRTEGWVWHDDLRRQRRMEPGHRYGLDFGYEGHQVSRYPFSCLTRDRVGLLLALPLDCPAMERRWCRSDTGLVHTVDLGLSPETSHPGPGRARWSFLLGAVEPKWGFRAAAERYYQAFPASFAKRVKREGAWLWPVFPDKIPHPEDFGLAFWEVGGSPSPAAYAAARQAGIMAMQYIEPTGLRQWFAEVKGERAMLSLDECLTRLRQMAAETGSTRQWSGGPEAEIARAVLNSLPAKADGTPPFWASNEYDVWAQWWYTNPSPYLPEPNRGRTCWTYEVLPRLPVSDGVYVDSVGLVQSTGFENHRAEHLRAARTMLTFDRESARPCLPAVSSFHDFLAWMTAELRSRDKLVMLNIGADPPAYRFFAGTGDVLGCEVTTRSHPGGRRPYEVESDEISCLRRTYAYRKPTTNLLQDGNWHKPLPVATHEDIEEYLQHQMFYGFYPAISTIGGEEQPGYAHWKRFFGSPEQYERDRDLFRRYLPVIQRLNAAGWEPVTLAVTDAPDEVLIERFGRWAAGELLFTLRGLKAATRNVKVTLDARSLGIPAADIPRLAAVDLLAERPLSEPSPGPDGTATLEVAVAGHDTLVISLGAARKARP